MIKYLILGVFLIYLVVPAGSVSDIEIQIQLVPFMPGTTMYLGQVIPIFASMGVGATILAGLAEWLQLRANNKQLQAEMDKLREEIASLRNLMIMERDTE